MSTHRLGREVRGIAGHGHEILFDTFDNPQHAATVASWFLTCPAQSPAWDKYHLSVFHLRRLPGFAAAKITLPRASHQLIVAALNPGRNPTSIDVATWEPLFPVNVSEQVQLHDDAQAVDLAYKAAEAVVMGYLPAEPPLSGQVEPWRTVLIKSSAHLRGEEHAP